MVKKKDTRLGGTEEVSLSINGEPNRRSETEKDVRQLLLEAAYKCFQRFGIQKTTMEDVASAAGVTRPTVYRYFKGKHALVDELSMREMYRITEAIRNHLPSGLSFEEKLTESLLIGTRLSVGNPYVRRSIESIEASSRISHRSHGVHAAVRAQWDRLLKQAQANGELAPDLDLEEVVSWLTLARTILFIKVDSVRVSDDELRHFIRRFIIAPLLRSP